MTHDDPERRLFDQALDQPTGPDRDAWLANTCAGDPALEERVRALLRAHEDDTAFLPPIHAEGPAAHAPSENAGDLIGRYKLLQQIGEGGFGTVWMAEQTEPVSRRVALKFIKLGMDTREVIARFEQERQALAMMDHPNIARVFDAGATDKGRPFFVMELVKGVPVTQYCDEAGLGTRERLAVFADVCAAIQHAHQKGVIHRDIKPSNVMVTLYADKPVVKVIDFGIAKATQGKLTDKTLFTRFERFIGTPAYMSPEQAALSAVDIDTRSDIYSLGVLLYELLTGKPPFDARSLLSAGYDEMRRIIREVEPPKPSLRLSTVAGEERATLAKSHQIAPDKLSRLVAADLDWIVMKALDKDRARRYETASGLAADVARFLTDEPVTARPPSAAYQFRKFARRNKAALRVAATLAAVLLAATLVSTWQAIRATKAETRATDTLVEVAAERDAKEQARSEAEAISTFLTDVFQSPDPTRDGRTITVAETLDKAAARLDTDLAGQPYRRAKLQATLGSTYHALGLTREAIPLKKKARDYFLTAFGPEHFDTFSAMDSLANSYHVDGRDVETLKLRKEVLALSRKVSGPEHPDTLAAMNNLALTYADSGHPDEALKLLESSLALDRKVSGPKHADTLKTMNNLASSYRDAGRRSEALKMREEVLKLSREVNGPNHPDTSKAMGSLAVSYNDEARYADALKLGEETLALQRIVLGPEHPDTLSGMLNLAVSYSETGRKDDALKLREELLPLSRKVNGPKHIDTLRAMNNLALSYTDADRKTEALKLGEETLALEREVLRPDHPLTLTTMTNLALSYADAGRRDEALKMQEELLPLSSKVLGPENPDTLGDMTNLAVSYKNAERLPEAIALQEQALAIKRRVLPENHPFLAAALQNMAVLYEKTNRKDEALKLREEGLALRRKVSGLEAPDTLAAMTNLAISYSGAGRKVEALKVREEVLKLSRKVNGPEDPHTLGAMTNLAHSLGEAGRLPEAIALQEEALTIKRRVLPKTHPYFAAALRNMAEFYEKSDRSDEALALRIELSALRTKPLPPVVATLVPPDSEWKWLHPTGGVDPAGSDADFHTTFLTPGYDDSAWQSGKDSAEFSGGFGYGYGRSFTGLDIGLPPDETQRHTAYFRHRFTTDEPHASLELRCQRDDGIIVYLDGKEVARDNMDAGPDTYKLPASRTVGDEDEITLQRIPLPGVSLPVGEHIIAISLHNPERPSSDLRIGGITLVEVESAPAPAP